MFLSARNFQWSTVNAVNAVKSLQNYGLLSKNIIGTVAGVLLLLLLSITDTQMLDTNGTQNLLAVCRTTTISTFNLMWSWSSSIPL